MSDIDDVDGFEQNHQDRKSSGAKKRTQQARPQRDGGKRMHRVGETHDRWRFDPSKLEDEDDFTDEDDHSV